MISPAHDIAKYLVAEGVGEFGGNSDWNINSNNEPATPDNVITVYDTGGEGPDTDDLDLFRPTFQVRSRSDLQVDAYTKQELIRDLLILSQPIITDNSMFVQIVMTSDIVQIGRDENKRFILTANYRALRQRS